MEKKDETVTNTENTNKLESEKSCRLEQLVMPLSDFYNWFNNNLLVKGYPGTHDKLINYDVIINVTDEFYLKDNLLALKNGKLWLWFPLAELKNGMSFHSLFAALTTLYQCETLNLKVYLHCSAGVNRSQTVSAMYYFLRTNTQLEKPSGGYINRMLNNIQFGALPSLNEIQKFLEKVKITLLEPNRFFGGELEYCLNQEA